jgi:glycosyltransferase involved in cell wall biosynthesis
VLEAMIQKKPVAVSSGVGISQLVEKANAGIIVSEEPEKMANSLKKIINNSEALASMGENGALTAKKFSWDRIAQEIERYYEL